MVPWTRLVPLEYSAGINPRNAMTLGGGGKAARVPEFGGDRQRRQIVDAAEAAEAFDPGAERLEAETFPELEVHRLQWRDSFSDGAHLGTVRRGERGPIPALRLEPLGVPFRPASLREEESPPVSEQEMREPVACAQLA